jgi:hypothetical protein
MDGYHNIIAFFLRLSDKFDEECLITLLNLKTFTLNKAKFYFMNH